MSTAEKDEKTKTIIRQLSRIRLKLSDVTEPPGRGEIAAMFRGVDLSALVEMLRELEVLRKDRENCRTRHGRSSLVGTGELGDEAKFKGRCGHTWMGTIEGYYGCPDCGDYDGDSHLVSVGVTGRQREIYWPV